MSSWTVLHYLCRFALLTLGIMQAIMVFLYIRFVNPQYLDDSHAKINYNFKKGQRFLWTILIVNIVTLTFQTLLLLFIGRRYRKIERKITDQPLFVHDKIFALVYAVFAGLFLVSTLIFTVLIMRLLTIHVKRLTHIAYVHSRYVTILWVYVIIHVLIAAHGAIGSNIRTTKVGPTESITIDE